MKNNSGLLEIAWPQRGWHFMYATKGNIRKTYQSCITAFFIFASKGVQPFLCDQWAILRSSTLWIMVAESEWCAGLPRSMPNANQYQSMPIKILELIQNTSQYRSMVINANQIFSILLNKEVFRKFDQNWSSLIFFLSFLSGIGIKSTMNLGRLWLAYTELQGDFYMLQFISVDSRHFTQT